jgi:hypothetical protein
VLIGGGLHRRRVFAHGHSRWSAGNRAPTCRPYATAFRPGPC